jgi:putative hemolysin
MPITDLLELSGQVVSATPPKIPLPRLFRRLTPIEKVRELYQRAQQPVNRSILENVLSGMRVKYQVTESDWARVPTNGPAIVTANHPFGLLDGAILGALLTRVRTDVKILTNFILAGIPELREHCIFVDPFGGSDAVARNRRGVRKAMDWLAVCGMLVVFPAGEVSHLRLQDRNRGSAMELDGGTSSRYDGRGCCAGVYCRTQQRYLPHLGSCASPASHCVAVE